MSAKIDRTEKMSARVVQTVRGSAERESSKQSRTIETATRTETTESRTIETVSRTREMTSRTEATMPRTETMMSRRTETTREGRREHCAREEGRPLG